MEVTDLKYLEALSAQYPTADAAAEAVACCEATLALPRGTELFASDIHGEYTAFSHLLRNGSGAVRALIGEVFGDKLTDEEKRELATVVCYPQEKIALVLAEAGGGNGAAAASDPAGGTNPAGDARPEGDAWLAATLARLAALAARAAARHTPAEVAAHRPARLGEAAAALMAAQGVLDREPAATALIESAIATGVGAKLAAELARLIQRLLVDQVHLIGDVYDRGPAPQLIMDELLAHPAVDVQWGNHDIVWMGASLGQPGCIAHVVRNCARYGNLAILEDAYGINLRPLAAFARTAYADDPCVAFGLKGNPGLSPEETELNVKIQKAMAIIQFKVEGRLIDENPSFGLDDRKLLHRIDPARGTVVVDGTEYELTDTVFPTVDWEDPYRLTPQEEAVVAQLEGAFTGCEKLQRHMRFFLEHGSLYKIANGNLLLHACVPLNGDGSLKEVTLFGETYKGRSLYDMVDRSVRAAFLEADELTRRRGRDLLWYLWLGPGSPLFAKSKMATFELYLIADKAARKEVKNAFYSLLDDASVVDRIFEDFHMDPATSRIICGHVPVKAKDGEDPVKGGGRVLTIDGGFSEAYQGTTGLAGYTLVSNAEGLFLDANGPLPSRGEAIRANGDIIATRRVIAAASQPLSRRATDAGAADQALIDDLKHLIEAYRAGLIAERR